MTIRYTALALLYFLSSLSLHAVEGSYKADVLPEEAAPKWGMGAQGNDASMFLSEACLRGEVENGALAYYAIGKDDKGREFGEWQAWDFAGESLLVELKVRWEAGNDDYEVFRVEISNGERRWVIPFYGHSIGIKRQPVEGNKFDVYRIVLHEGSISLYSERMGLIQKNLRPFSSTEACQLLFGSYWNKQNQQQSDHAYWELQSIKWTDDRAAIEQALQQ